MSNSNPSGNTNPTSTPRAGAEATIEELRAEYRALAGRVEMEDDLAHFNERVACCNGGWNNGRWESKTPTTPQEWVEAARDYVDRSFAELDPDDYDDEGYMGTGMSEAAYYRAAGSAE